MDKLNRVQRVKLKPNRPRFRKEVKQRMKIIVGPASVALGEKIADLTGYEKVSVEAKIFPDGENYVRLEGSVQDEHVAIVHTTSFPQDSRLMQLAFLVVG